MPRKPTGRPVGRPTVHTPELAEAIAIRIASGESLRAICQDPNIDSFGWLDLPTHQ
jgi:hypothetical protein